MAGSSLHLKPIFSKSSICFSLSLFFLYNARCRSPSILTREKYPRDKNHKMWVAATKEFYEKHGTWRHAIHLPGGPEAIEIRDRVIIELYCQGLTKTEIGRTIGMKSTIGSEMIFSLIERNVLPPGGHPFPHEPAEDDALSFLTDVKIFTSIGSLRRGPSVSKFAPGMCRDCGLPQNHDPKNGENCLNRPLGPKFSTCGHLRTGNALTVTECCRIISVQKSLCGLCETPLDDKSSSKIVIHHNHWNLIERNRDETVRSTTMRFRFGAPMFTCDTCNTLVGRVECQYEGDLNLTADNMEEEYPVIAKNLRQQVRRTPKPPKINNNP